MRIPSAGSLLLATSALLSSQQVAGAETQPSDQKIVQSRRYIVQFSKEGQAQFTKRDDAGPDTQLFYEKLEQELPAAKASAALNLTSSIFSGASFDLSNPTDETIEKIKSLNEIENIWEADILHLPPVKSQAIGTAASQTWDPHNYTFVNQIHARGGSGKGVVIAVVDSGIDYTHPALGGGYGEGFKVAGGYDLVGDDYSPDYPDINPDNDPKDCLGHGTHVAGIIAGSSDTFVGVAPEATLRAYKVFGCEDGTSEDFVVQAFIRAFEDGADIITASLGSPRGFPDNPLALVASRIVEQGVFVSGAAGNDGDMGPYFTSSLATGESVVSVGSVEADQIAGWPVIATAADGSSIEFAYVSAESNWDLEGNFTAYFMPELERVNVCNSIFNSDVPANNVLITARGSCSWQAHDGNLLGYAKYVFFWNFQNGAWEYPFRTIWGPDEQPKISLITYESGIWIREKAKLGKVTLTFSKSNGQIGLPNPAVGVGLPNIFSTWGPSIENRLKPEIVAPGGNIFSTYLTSQGNWAVLSGTSMATPYIAGVAALFLESRNGRKSIGTSAGLLTKSRLIASGQTLALMDGTKAVDDMQSSIAQQGPGLVNALKVLDLDTDVSPAILHLNDSTTFVSKHDIEIKNSGSQAVTYKFFHGPGTSVLTNPQRNNRIQVFPVVYAQVQNTTSASVVFSQDSLTVEAGAVGKIQVTFSEPTALDAAQLPIYGGKILVDGNNGESLSIPYLGIFGSTRDHTPWDKDGSSVTFTDSATTPFKSGATFSLSGEGNSPKVLWGLWFHTRELSIDLVETTWQQSDFVWPPAAGQNKWINHLRGRQVNGLSEPTKQPYRLLPRRHEISNTFTFSVDNVFTDATKIPDGEYRIVARALSLWGDEKRLEDWQFAVSEPFKVVGNN